MPNFPLKELISAEVMTEGRREWHGIWEYINTGADNEFYVPRSHFGTWLAQDLQLVVTHIDLVVNNPLGNAVTGSFGWWAATGIRQFHEFTVAAPPSRMSTSWDGVHVVPYVSKEIPGQDFAFAIYTLGDTNANLSLMLGGHLVKATRPDDTFDTRNYVTVDGYRSLRRV